MLMVRISGAAFLALALYMLAAPMIVEAMPGAGPIAIAALALGWYFALWAALVAAMLFIISWTVTAMARDATSEAPARAVVEEQTHQVPLARAS